MNEVLKALRNRRSVRQYTSESIPREMLDDVLRAGLLSESSRGRQPWCFLVVQERETLEKMSHCRMGSAKMLATAGAAIVVLGDTEKSDMALEDCAVAMANMHLAADSLGLGSCWIQGRLRDAENGQTTEEYLRDLLRFPMSYQLEAILSLGMPLGKPAPHNMEELPWDMVRWERF